MSDDQTRHDAGEVYRRMTAAFTAGDQATLTELIAEDVVWHTDDLQTEIPSEYVGREAFFAAASTPNPHVSGWEVINHVVLSDGSTGFSHQIDRFTLNDGTKKDIHFLLHITLNEAGQVKEVWEFGQSALPH